MGTFQTLGNSELLMLYKTAFLCSRKCPAAVVLKAYDWAIEQRERGSCVISGFHSQIEKDVLHYLLKGAQPIIVVLARGMKRSIEPEFRTEIRKDRLLIISPFDESVKRASVETALIRNRLMMDLADEIVIAYAAPQGNLNRLIKEYPSAKSRVL